MLPAMNPADGEAPHLDAAPRPSASGNAAPADAKSPMQGCPFLVAEAGGWRLDQPSRAHRCGAVSPSAPLSPEKQGRLCLTEAHATCATLLASVAARDARLGAPPVDRATRWGLARTTTIIEEPGGIRSRVTGLLDRGRWPAIPAVLLVVTLITLAASGFRPGAPAAAETTATPAHPGSTAATARPTVAPSFSAPPTAAPSAASTSRPSKAPSPTPRATPAASPAYTTYRVKSGDTLSGIASQFGTTSRAIADLNGISVSTTLHIGQVLKIPK
jgi:LysM repeat protein